MAGTIKPWLLVAALCICAFAFAENASPSAERPPQSLEAEVNIMGKSAAPFVRDHWVVFSFRPAPAARYVALRFEHESYATLHPLLLNEKKLFILIYRPPEGLARLTYRMCVDGMWMRDPANPDFTTDALGTEYSNVGLENLLPEPPRDPMIARDGRVTFTYRGTPGRLVSIAATFNLWDPFVHVLDEVSPGVYTIAIRLLAGPVHYYFLENGNKRLDPANGEIRHDSEGELVSYFHVP